MAAQLIVALDLPRKEDALVLARELQGAVPWCKVGMELFTLAGPDIIRELHDLGFHVFLDMKFYDIPHTVAQAVKAAAAAGAELLTLHCQGGERMCSEARIAADSYGSKAPQLFGVTALTSFGPGEMPGISADPSDFALELAGKARGWGLDGVVCSPLEAGRIHETCTKDFLTVTPGIRFADAKADDQVRITTPAKAREIGSDYIVVGRPITQAEDPVAAYRRCVSEFVG